MNILDGISVRRTDIVDAYTKVYGDKYKNIIANRVDRIMIFEYEDIDGIREYCKFLRDCKQKELSIKFLKEIGIDINNNEEQNYAERLSDDIENLICKYIGSYKAIDPEFEDDVTGILTWKFFDEDTSSNAIIEERINFINFLRGQDKVQITKETYQSFCQTDEYNQIRKRIEEYLQVYNDMVKQYEDYTQKEIEPHEEHVKDERIRKRTIVNNRRNLLYEQIYEILPHNVKDYLDENYYTIYGRREAIFYPNSLGMKSNIEYFSQEDEDKLNNSTISENDKNWIYYYRLMYFSNIGVLGRDYGDFDIDNAREVYERCIKNESIKRLIIPTKIADEITEKRTKEYEESKREFVFNSQNFIKNTKSLDDDSKEIMYALHKDKEICMTPGICNEEFVPVISYCILESSCGVMDYLFLHEAGHAIETIDNSRSGFDNLDDKRNPYNTKKRKYERLNEIITDIFAIEARQYLHEKEKYLFEPRELIVKNVNDNNTHSIEKDLLTTFLDKYREPIIRARLFDEMKELYDIIGEENFEELNDIVNKVDYLIYFSDLGGKLKNNQNEDPIVMQYYEQLGRLNQVYNNMEMHQKKQTQGDDLLKSAISTTEEKIRLGKINSGMAIITNTLQKRL